MEIAAEPGLLRRWRRGDEASLVRYANNRRIWRHLLDRFPNPYGPAEAKAWIDSQQGIERPTNLAIEYRGEAVGSVGLEPFTDVYRRTAEVGYWIAEAHWGRGLATAAVVAFTDYAFANFDFERLQATVFATNPASGRVLEKAGYHLEGRLRRAIFKDGEVLDAVLWARIRTPEDGGAVE
ncbi:MAG: GNAT family N-acetyltransferase [Acidobacteriota bacterium]